MFIQKKLKEVLLEGGPQDGATVELLAKTRVLWCYTKVSTGLGHKYEDAGDDMTFVYKGEMKEGT